MESYATTHKAINGFIVSYLADLKAVESVSLVKDAYKADKSNLGDFDDFQIAVGLLDEHQTSQPRYQQFTDPKNEWRTEKKASLEKDHRKSQQAQKEKKKRKQARKTRRGKRGKK